MPTPATVIDNTLRDIGALCYIVLLFVLAIFITYECYIEIKERKGDNNAKRECADSIWTEESKRAS